MMMNKMYLSGKKIARDGVAPVPVECPWDGGVDPARFTLLFNKTASEVGLDFLKSASGGRCHTGVCRAGDVLPLASERTRYSICSREPSHRFG